MVNGGRGASNSELAPDTVVGQRKLCGRYKELGYCGCSNEQLATSGVRAASANGVYRVHGQWPGRRAGTIIKQPWQRTPQRVCG